MKYLILVFVLFTFSTNINQKPVVASYGIEPTVYLIGDNVEDWYQELTDPEWEEYPRPYGARYYDPIANLVYLVTNIVEVSNIIYTYDPNKQEKLYAIPPLSKNTNLFFQYLGNISSLQRVYKSTKNNKIYIKIMHPFTNTNNYWFSEYTDGIYDFTNYSIQDDPAYPYITSNDYIVDLSFTNSKHLYYIDQKIYGEYSLQFDEYLSNTNSN